MRSKMMNLLDVCDFQGGTQPPKEEWVDNPREGYVRMLQIRDYSQGDEKYIQYVKDNGKLHKCCCDDIMLSRYGYIGQAFSGLEGAYNVALVKVIKKIDINTRYLYHYFCSYYFRHCLLSNVGERATIPGFNKSELKSAVIPVPEPAEQTMIADVLDRLDALRSKQLQQLEKIDLLIKSQFIEKFGDPVKNDRNWKVCTLDSISEVMSSKRIFEREYVTNGIPFFRTKEVVELSKGEQITTELYISEERFAEIKKEFGGPRQGDLLISAVGTIGVIWIVDDREFYFKDGNLLQVRARVNSYFLKYVLEWLIADYKQEMSKGTAYAALTINALKKLRIIDVPLTAQNEFARFVEQTEKSKSTIKHSLDKLTTLKNALMQKYFG